MIVYVTNNKEPVTNGVWRWIAIETNIYIHAFGRCFYTKLNPPRHKSVWWHTWSYHDALCPDPPDRFIMDSSVLILPLDEDGPLQTLSVFLWLFSALNRISVFGDCLWWNEALQRVWSHFILADLTSSLILGWSFIAQETKRQHETSFYSPYKNLSTVWDCWDFFWNSKGDTWGDQGLFLRNIYIYTSTKTSSAW